MIDTIFNFAFDIFTLAFSVGLIILSTAFFLAPIGYFVERKRTKKRKKAA